MSAKLLTENYLEFLRLKGGCTGSSESTLVKLPHCWKSHVTAQMFWREINKLVSSQGTSWHVRLSKTQISMHIHIV